MFTGIVRELGVVVGAAEAGGGRTLTVRAAETASRTALGGSVAIDGCCLTAAAIDAGVMVFHAVPETIARTTLGDLVVDDRVNVEPAIRAGDELGGHYVQGHVDAVGRIQSVEAEGEGLRVFVEAPDEVLRYCVEKGSITVDGVSLTIAELAEDSFAVALVPHTLAATTLSDLEPGQAVNLEADVLAKYVERLLRSSWGNLPVPPDPLHWSAVADRHYVPGYDPTVATDMRAPETASPFATIEEAIEDIRSGRFVVVVDDADRENEGDLTIAAQFVTPDAVNFMATHGRGLICLCLTPDRCDELELRQMSDHNETPLGTAFTVSIEAREGVSTGISAADRARTIQVAIDPNSVAHDLVQPGHVFPLRAKQGGVLQRSGQTEAAVDLARLAGVLPAGVVCEIMNEDGTMARVSDLTTFCARHELKMVTVADLIEYRRRREKLVERVVSVRLPTELGEFRAVAYRELLTGKQHVALVKGDIEGAENVLVRVHSECLTGDVFHSLLCDCGEQLEHALARVEEDGRGVVLYMGQEGRGIGLLNKLRAYELQATGLDTVEANLALGFPPDAREWGIGNQILADLGLTTIRILTNNPRKLTGLDGYGLTVVEQVPLEVEPTAENARYLAAKREKLGHTITKLHHQGARLDATPEDSE